MKIMNNIADYKCVDVFYDYFKGKDNEISIQLKNMVKSELAELVLENIKGENTEKALMCQIYAFGMKGTKFNNEIIELANLYLTLYSEGEDLITVLSRLAKAYISEYEIQKALEVCKMLKEQDYDYIHAIYAECLYKVNRLEEAVAFLEERLVVVKEKGGQETDEKQQKLSEKITEITGITNEMVADAPEISIAISEFKDFIEEYDLVGHNVLFDMKFLDLNLAKIGKSISCKIYDTLKLSKNYFKGIKSYKLTELSRTFNIEHTYAHRALSDAETTAKLYMKCFREECK